MWRRALGASVLALLACGPADPADPATRPESSGPLKAPARTLALVAADLPGFTLREELTPAEQASGDAYGRVGSYAATFEATSGGSVTSAVNTYVGEAEAQSAFVAWRAAVPRQFSAITIPMAQSTPESVAYAREGDVLFGFRVRNVLASVRAPAAEVERLAKLVLGRCRRG
jgi:hypothetical protein